MSEKINISIIGAGSIAQVMHLPLLAKFKDINIQSVCDINKNIVKAVAEKFEVPENFTDYKKMLAGSDCDAVIISTPTGTHKQITLDCIREGKDIFVEKPITPTSTEAEEIILEAEKYKVKVMVGMNMRYRPDLMMLKSILSSGEIGKPFYVKCGWLRSQSSIAKWFTVKEDAGGGVIFDLGIVLLDISLWLLDFPVIKSVSTQNYSVNTKGVEDSSISMIRAEPDSVINLETSWSLPGEKDSFYLEIHGSKGTCMVNPLRIARSIQGEMITLSPVSSVPSKDLLRKSYENELKHFIGAIKGINPIFSPAIEGMARLKLIESMYKSASLKKEILF